MAFSALPIALVVFQSSVTLHYQPVVGKAYRYSMTMSSNNSMAAGQNMSMTSKMNITMKPLSRTAGKTTVQSTVDSVKVTAPQGSPAANMTSSMEKSMKASKTTLVMDSQGKIVSMNATGGNPMMGQMGQNMGGMMTFAYPKTPVRVGSSWSIPMDFGKMMAKTMPNMAVTGKMPIVMRVMRIYGQQGRTLVQLAMTMNGVMNMGAQGRSIATKMNSAGTLVIDAATGMPVSQQQTMTGATTFGKQTMKSTTVIAMKAIG